MPSRLSAVPGKSRSRPRTIHRSLPIDIGFDVNLRKIARAEFVEQIENSLDIAQTTIRAVLNDPTATLEVVPHFEVQAVIRGWQSLAILDWALASKICRSVTKSCFIGLRTNGQVCVLSLVRLSRGRLHTKLLFLEKDRNPQAAPNGIMTLVDAVLETIAQAFGSNLIVIDKPLEGVVAYYAQHHYGVLRKCGKKVVAMARVVQSS
ncbi:hypothetical protein HF908_15130 [Ralstonia pseudosolanacearum]|uniref:hypothetical protein n=1 Tax=Ralstonia pseudosolanacearum TaxID=1310165 RepID=UPI00186649E0|nr:hypothetical protein [Ralstonia pseudosolanacearum]QOK92680.1 hypothetical protein HF908_15130 [Ralstonia pseudosolanacearum]